MSEPSHLQPGTPAYRRANLALFLGGWATFVLLYGPQPLLPRFAQEFAVSAAAASLLISAAAAALALMLIPASLLADRFGRDRLMKASLVLAALFTLLLPLAETFSQVLWLRALSGVAAAGLPAAAMAWLGDEMAPLARARAMGLYIAGNALGGMSGRFLAALLADFAGWHVAFAVLGVLGAAVAVGFWRLLPPARQFHPRSLRPRAMLADLRSLFTDAVLPGLFLVAFLLMGAFVAFYNYLAFRLSAPPFSLPETLIGALFLLYALGTGSSTLSGRLAERYSPGHVALGMTLLMGCGLALSLSLSLAWVVIGVALMTIGFFAVHATASAWVGSCAGPRRALASALYLTAYYLGASLPPMLAGLAWQWRQWPGVVLVLGCLLLGVLATVITLMWRRRAD